MSSFSQPTSSVMLRAMLGPVVSTATRIRVLIQRALLRLGFREDAFLLLIAVAVGIVTSAAAVGFHELISLLRNFLYHRFGADLYDRWIWMLVVWPTLGGLTVGLLVRYVFRAREGHGVVDVIESVVRSDGFVKPISAIEKILTSAITIGTGGSTGAEGPIVQIGAAISSAFGSLFTLARQQMPIVVGCGAAAGISAIFNAPIGGLLFTLEVILRDFSIRTITPVVVASVVANVTTQAIYRVAARYTEHTQQYDSIFHVPSWVREAHADVLWPQLAAFATLGAVCGLLAVILTKSMWRFEEFFAKRKWPAVLKPAIGGMVLGVMGIAYVLIFHPFSDSHPKPIPIANFAPPAFYSDGYGAIQVLLGPEFYAHRGFGYLVALLTTWVVAKIVGTCLTLASGGSGGVIAPALFIGAAGGGLLGLLLRSSGFFANVRPELYALLGMAGVLAAVVHAPLASILILMEITGDSSLVLPAMLTAVAATGVARFILPDSIYTHSLRARGVPVGTGTDLLLLRRMSIEQVEMRPANVVAANESIERVLTAIANGADANFIAVDETGNYLGLIGDDDLRIALIGREATPLLLVRDVMRSDIRPISTSDDLLSVMDRFAATNAECLPVTVKASPKKVIGIISRTTLMARYRQAVQDEG